MRNFTMMRKFTFLSKASFEVHVHGALEVSDFTAKIFFIPMPRMRGNTTF